MMGFDINDIVSFMISDAVSLVNEVSSVNMFDEYMFDTNIDEAVRILQGYFPVSKFFYGSVKDSEDSGDPEDSEGITELKTIAYNKIKGSLQKALQEVGLVTRESKKGKDGKTEVIGKPRVYGKNQFSKILHDFYICKLQGRINKSLIDFAVGAQSQVKNNIMALSDYIDNIIEKVKATGVDFTPVDLGDTADFELTEFAKDLTEFSHVYELATETSTLGSTFLGLNQGIPTSKPDLLNKVIKIQQAISKRQSKFGISHEALRDAYAKPNDKTSRQYLGSLVDLIKSNNDYIDSSTILPIIQQAFDLGIIGGFDFFKWLEDTDGYRKITSEYYNLIKGTWNIFDIIERLPHFESIFQNFKAILTIDEALIKKSQILNLIANNLFGSFGYVDPQSIEKLTDYVDDLLILRWINKQQLKFPIDKNDPFFLFNWEEVKYTGDEHFFTIQDEASRGTFKKLFEEKLFPMLQEGYYINSKGEREVIGNNKFIQNLDIDINSNGQNYLKLNLDMQNISGTAENEYRYQECLSDFYKLKNFKLGNKTLADWFMFYNLIIHKNKFGSDRLTTLFGPFIDKIKEKSLIEDMLQKVGDFDFSDLESISSRDLLNELGYNRDDALLRIAPIISTVQESNTQAEIVREVKDGLPVYKRKKGNFQLGYGKEQSIIPGSSTNIYDPNESRMDKIIRTRNWIKYGVLSLPFSNRSSSNITNLASGDLKLVLSALRNYMKQGIITFYTENC